MVQRYVFKATSVPWHIMHFNTGLFPHIMSIRLPEPKNFAGDFQNTEGHWSLFEGARVPIPA